MTPSLHPADSLPSLVSLSEKASSLTPQHARKKMWFTDRTRGTSIRILEAAAENDRLPHVGWIRGEWHGRRHRHRLTDVLARTHVAHVDSNPPHECGLFVARRI